MSAFFAPLFSLFSVLTREGEEKRRKRGGEGVGPSPFLLPGKALGSKGGRGGGKKRRPRNPPNLF